MIGSGKKSRKSNEYSLKINSWLFKPSHPRLFCYTHTIMSETSGELPVVTNGEADKSPTDEVLEASKRMNLAEKDELQRLGYQVDPKGNVSSSPKLSLLATLKNIVLGDNTDRRQKTEDRNNDVPNLSRRKFLINLAKLTAGTTVGLKIGFPESIAKARDEDETGSDTEIESRRVSFKEGYINTDSIRTLVLADKMCFFENAPSTDTDGGVLPANNDQFYHHRQAELLGFVDKPSFLILHTDGGTDIRSTIQSLNNRDIHCQFMVGTINEEPLSIQAAYLQRNLINVTGTVSGGDVNPYEANIQFWGSLNVEIEGTPNNVESPLLDKAVQLCLDIMPVYRLKMSQVIGHMEVPNNGKPDPGRRILRDIRTKIYEGLLEKGLYDLIDIFPDDASALTNYFIVDESPSGAAELNNDGRVKCWLPNEDSYVDWDSVNSFLSDNPNLADELNRYRNGTFQVISVRERQNRELHELYMGFPPSFTDWLRQPNKPLGTEEFSEYRPNGTANFIYRIRNILTNNAELLGSSLPFSYNVAQNLARMFVAERPYENRGSDIPEALVSIAENIGDIDQSWRTVTNAYQVRYGNPIVLLHSSNP